MPSHEQMLFNMLVIQTKTYLELPELWAWNVGGVSVLQWGCGSYRSSSDLSISFFAFFSSVLFLLD
jgi:hypothetical protein